MKVLYENYTYVKASGVYMTAEQQNSGTPEPTKLLYGTIIIMEELINSTTTAECIQNMHIYGNREQAKRTNSRISQNYGRSVFHLFRVSVIATILILIAQIIERVKDVRSVCADMNVIL